MKKDEKKLEITNAQNPFEEDEEKIKVEDYTCHGCRNAIWKCVCMAGGANRWDKS